MQKSTGNILAGNHTYKALVGMGETEIPAIFVDVDNETATRILLADNRTADLGEYDEQQLNQLLKGLEEFTGTVWAVTALIWCFYAIQAIREKSR